MAGILYQALGERQDRVEFPPPGQLVDVGGHRLHIHCQGEGEPVVILLNLSGGLTPYWAWVQPELARQTRVCAYDRAGFGWSDPYARPSGEYAAGTVQDLHSLLANAGLSGPYVLVGHSLGGIFARMYADEYPQEVAGIVLLDASHPDQLERSPEMASMNEAFLRQSAVFPLLARVGLFRLYFDAGGEIDFQGLPPRQHDEIAAFWSTPRYFNMQRAENVAAPGIFQQAQRLGSLGDLPLAVFTASETGPFPLWPELQAEMAGLSSNSLHRTIEGATHGSVIFNPHHARITREVIAMVIDAARSGTPVAEISTQGE
jgi:pimeloyl-ACP methyl ester carboxylesterase